MQEAAEGVINLPDDDPDAVAKMIEFLYIGDYTMAAKEDLQPPVTFSAPAKRQKTATQRKKRGSTATQSGTRASQTEEACATEKDMILHIKIYILGDKYDIQPLKSLALKRYTRSIVLNWSKAPFCESILLAYENTPDSNRIIRQAILEEAYKNRRELLRDGAFISLLKECPDFSADLLQHGTVHSQSIERVSFICTTDECKDECKDTRNNELIYSPCLHCGHCIKSFYRISGDHLDQYWCAYCEHYSKKEEMLCGNCGKNDHVLMIKDDFKVTAGRWTA